MDVVVQSKSLIEVSVARRRVKGRSSAVCCGERTPMRDFDSREQHSIFKTPVTVPVHSLNSTNGLLHGISLLFTYFVLPPSFTFPVQPIQHARCFSNAAISSIEISNHFMQSKGDRLDDPSFITIESASHGTFAATSLFPTFCSQSAGVKSQFSAYR